MAPLGELDAFVKNALVNRLERSELKQEVLAELMGISKQQLSMQLRPGGHISLTRLLLAAEDEDGKRFLQMLWTDIADHLGLENTDAIAQELQRFHGRLAWVIDRVQVRMARADLRAAIKKRA